ncbi:DUF2057 family protein [Yersinia kristensenii]|uniref:DUF2057 family protein n=1 Tax=Yersinia kristensenii TaxID=28152 RepID=UPI0001A54EBE|nr:DUF2057 family protein [Yersinia kristensenii]EEP92221.1 hypothetical protein ykris0001_430 [Yersinia kristensenii ATCC 33638]SUP70588.1 Uncharacterized protein conserved in bacteria (DUF2057) [Yersinia kristensenii]
MKVGLVVVGILAVCCNASAIAMTLKLAPEIDLLVVDGKNMSGSLLKGADSLELNSGQHQILFKVAKPLPADPKILYASPPLVVVFNTRNTSSVAIKLPTIETERDASKFSKNPAYQLIGDNGRPLSVRHDVLHQDNLNTAATLETAMATYNVGQFSASVPSFAKIPPSPVSAVPGTTIAVAGTNTVQKKTNLQGENVAEQMLQYWFLQADAETQQRFLLWAKKQPTK